MSFLGVDIVYFLKEVFVESFEKGLFVISNNFFSHIIKIGVGV